MSALDTNRMITRSGRAGMMAKIMDAAAAWNDARVTRNALSKLSERELNDIGLTRFDVEHIGR